MAEAFPFSYDARTNRYRHGPSGRFIPNETVRAAVDQVLDAATSSVQGLSEQLRAGQISLQEWRQGMEATIKTAHVAAGVIARGGAAQVSQADLGWLGSQIKTQYAALDNFAAQIVSGAQPLNGTLTSRAQLYAQAGRGTHRAMETRIARIGGANEERNILGGADHCPGCLGATEQGWVPIGTLTPVGQRQCSSNCRCVIGTRTTSASDQVVSAEDQAA